MNGDDLLKGGAEASATGVFGTVVHKPAQEEAARANTVVPSEPPIAPVVKREPAMAAPSGGFTQLLRALNYDQVKESTSASAAKAEPIAADGDVDGRVPRVPESSGEARESLNRAVVQPPSAQVTSFLPQHPPGTPAPVPLPGGSFTRLFQTLEAEPAKQDAANQAAGHMRTAEPSGALAEPGAFTQMFAMPSAMQASKQKRDANEGAAGSSTELFTGDKASRDGFPGSDENENPLPAPQPPLMIDAVEPASTGPRETPPVVAPSFTQMFQALDAPVAAPAPPVRAEPNSAPPAAAPTAPGSFTQMFQTLREPPAADMKPVSLAGPVAREVGPAPNTPGSFTQMFQTLGEPPPTIAKAEPVQAGAPESFTQMFQLASPAPPTISPLPILDEQPSLAGPREPNESGASQIFATYRKPRTDGLSERGPAFSALEAAPREHFPSSSMIPAPQSAGLTQLLRALDKPIQQPSMPPPYAPSMEHTAASPSHGSFTGVYGELGTPAVAPPPVAPTEAPQTGTGPSEFTRILNASALREGALRGEGSALGGGPHGVAESPASGGGALPLPHGLPRMQASFSGPSVPHGSFSAPAAPHASFSGPGGAQGSLSAAGGGQASLSGPHVPHAPVVPQIKLPEVAKAAPSAGMQKYVPLLLILVIFLLLAILVAVVFLMKK